jgi:cob(I)alamin adenosyltransferase
MEGAHSNFSRHSQLKAIPLKTQMTLSPRNRPLLISFATIQDFSMSIATRTGDDGTTGLMYNRRVPKTHPRVEAGGSIDELNAALGLARASGRDEWLGPELLAIQQQLVTVMGELATAPEDLERYARDGFARMTPELTGKLDALVKHLEAQSVTFKGWAMPGGTMQSAALDLARTACRRAERRVCAVREVGETVNPEIVIYLNRLSDVLWLMGRWIEARTIE